MLQTRYCSNVLLAARLTDAATVCAVYILVMSLQCVHLNGHLEMFI